MQVLNIRGLVRLFFFFEILDLICHFLYKKRKRINVNCLFLENGTQISLKGQLNVAAQKGYHNGLEVHVSRLWSLLGTINTISFMFLNVAYLSTLQIVSWITKKQIRFCGFTWSESLFWLIQRISSLKSYIFFQELLRILVLKLEKELGDHFIQLPNRQSATLWPSNFCFNTRKKEAVLLLNSF